MIWAFRFITLFSLCFAQPVLKISDCCKLDLSSHHLLIECVNSTLAATEQSSFEASAPYIQSAQGPSLSVVIITRATHHVYEYAAYSMFLQAFFAEKNGYSLLKLPHIESNTSDFQYYRKLAPMIEALDTVAAHADFLVWMDADLVILDHQMRIEQIAASYPAAHILMSADVSSLVNSGLIIVRNTAWSRAFLLEWHAEHNHNHVQTDQLGFSIVYNRRKRSEMLSRVTILPPYVLNSEAPPMARQEPGHQVLHLAAESTKLRKAVFQHGKKEVCRVFSEGALHHSPHASPPGLALQLGMTRSLILVTTRDIYHTSTLEIINEIERSLGQSPGMMQSTVLLSRLRQSASKYCFALVYANGGQETAESLAMRLQVYKMVRACVSSLTSYQEAMKLQRRLAKSGGKIAHKSDLSLKGASISPLEHIEFPEQVKLSVELAFETLNAIGYASPEHDAVSEYIREALEILERAVSPSQVKYAWEMKAGYLYYNGQLALMQGQAKQAQFFMLQTIGVYLQMDTNANPPATATESVAEIFVSTTGALHTSIPSSVLSESQIWEALLGGNMQFGAHGDIRGKLGAAAGLAGACCMLGQHHLGVPLFRQVLKLEADQFGEFHPNLADKYANAGMCFREGYSVAVQKSLGESLSNSDDWQRWWIEGEKLLHKAIRVIRASPSGSESDKIVLDAVERELLRSM